MDSAIPLEDEKADRSHELDMLKMMQRCLSEDDIIFHSRQILNHDGGREQHEADFYNLASSRECSRTSGIRMQGVEKLVL